MFRSCVPGCADGAWSGWAGGGGQHSALKSLGVHLVSEPEPDQAQSANEGQPFFSKNQGTAFQ